MPSLLDQLSSNTSAGPFHQDDAAIDLSAERLPVRAIAYYLPQFHSIPENDGWWGKGFTEWTNVTKAFPRFVGHYQPHLPGELGFYDLRQADVLRRQARLARRYGIAGFCFHYYWFSGRKLLETPLNLLLANPDIDIGFCINWANESWTRRWSGAETSILMKQEHSPEDDLALGDDLERLVADPRYIRVDGRPLVMIYRPGALPDARSTVSRWRAHFSSRGLPEPYVVMAQGFGDVDPRLYGMDAAAGFPPHVVGWEGSPQQQKQILFDEQYRGIVFSYDEMVMRAAANRPRAFRLFPGVCPQWDNEARKPGRGTAFIGSTPQKYGDWLRLACAEASSFSDADERIVFINAWNEWAEGAHLEPDRHFGYGYLAETAQALRPRPAVNGRATGVPSDATNGFVTDRAALAFRFRLGLRKAANKIAGVADRLSDTLRSQ